MNMNTHNTNTSGMTHKSDRQREGRTDTAIANAMLNDIAQPKTHARLWDCHLLYCMKWLGTQGSAWTLLRSLENSSDHLPATTIASAFGLILFLFSQVYKASYVTPFVLNLSEYVKPNHMTQLHTTDFTDFMTIFRVN